MILLMTTQTRANKEYGWRISCASSTVVDHDDILKAGSYSSLRFHFAAVQIEASVTAAPRPDGPAAFKEGKETRQGQGSQ